MEDFFYDFLIIFRPKADKYVPAVLNIILQCDQLLGRRLFQWYPKETCVSIGSYPREYRDKNERLSGGNPTIIGRKIFQCLKMSQQLTGCLLFKNDLYVS